MSNSAALTLGCTCGRNCADGCPCGDGAEDILQDASFGASTGLTPSGGRFGGGVVLLTRRLPQLMRS